MAFTPEDGTGVDGANSYVDMDVADAIMANHGYTQWAAAAESVREFALIKATTYLDNFYAAGWPGSAVGGRSQSLAWPREDVVDSAGDEIDDDEVPREVQHAVVHLALMEIQQPGILMPAPPPVAGVAAKKRVKVGPLEVEYDLSKGVANGGGLLPSFPSIDSLLSNVLFDDEGETEVAFLTRV